jgi:RecA-family ATPase
VSAIQLHEQPLPVVRAVELDTTPDEQRWLIEALWMHSAVGVIGGTPKSLKTWLGLEMAVSVASGTACLDQFTVQAPGPALIYLAEDRLCTVRERLEALCVHRGLSLETLDLHVITVPVLRLDTRIDVSRLDATLRSYHPRLLLLDPFVRLHKSDENSAQDIAMILAALRELQRRHDVAIVVVHHTRKNQRANQHGQTLRGSGDFHAWSDSALYLTHRKQALQLTAEHRSASAPRPWYLRLHDEPSYLTLVEPDPQDDQPSLEQRVLQTLQQNPAPLHRNQLRTMLAVNNSRLGDVLGALEKRGRAHRTNHGWTC